MCANLLNFSISEFTCFCNAKLWSCNSKKKLPLNFWFRANNNSLSCQIPATQADVITKFFESKENNNSLLMRGL